MFKIDMNRAGYSFYSRRAQLQSQDVEWFGIVNYSGVRGALGFCPDGHFYMFRTYLPPLLLDTDMVIAALPDGRCS